MPAPSRTPEQILLHRQIIAERYLRGEYQADIARDLGVSQQLISYDLKAIRAAWLASAIRDFDAAKAQELAKIDAVEREYWAAWRRSQQDKEAITEEQIDDPVVFMRDGEPQIEAKTRTKRSSRKEGQAGNATFLDGVLRCIERRCKILGLDAPQRFIIEDWDALTPEQIDRLADGDPPEKVLAA